MGRKCTTYAHYHQPHSEPGGHFVVPDMSMGDGTPAHRVGQMAVTWPSVLSLEPCRYMRDICSRSLAPMRQSGDRTEQNSHGGFGLVPGTWEIISWVHHFSVSFPLISSHG